MTDAPPRPAAPPDAPARQRIVDELDATLFVEAGAGSGKTTALVDRVLGLVASGEAELRSIAAITFTEKAAAELRDRIRRGLEVLAGTSPDPAVVDRCRLAVDQLDSAAIGTLHAFAQRVLAENPLEAGLPPRIEVLDEIASDVEFERRWSAFRDELLGDAALERTLLLLFATGVRPDALRILALRFDQNWDLVDERVAADAGEPPSVHDLLEKALGALDTACAARPSCRDAADKLLVRLDELHDHAARLRTIDDELDLLAELGDEAQTKAPSFRVGGIGKAGAWDDGARDEVRALVAAAGDAFAEVAGEVAQACARRIAAAVRGFTLGAALERRTAGQLQFHDLLVLARALLRSPEHGADVRTRLHDRYRHLLLDEFQDTDPIQVEVAVRIAALDPGGEAAGRDPWPVVPVRPGQLFLVGDPKQSIYRFRRADISTFLRARDRLGVQSGGTVELSANFRTVEAVISWVNSTFDVLMGEVSPIDLPVPSQPAYVPLQATRADPPVGPPISVIAREEVAAASAAELRAAEAEAVAATIGRVLAEAWSIGSGDPAEPWRPARLGDITVLVPARTSLPFLEDALDAAHIPYRAESSSLVYSSRAVRELLGALRAVDDPTDHLHIVAALRSPLFGCGDDDLFRFKVERGGRWSYLADQPDTVPADDPVRAGLAYLRQLHDQRRFLSPSEMLDRLARDRRSFELGFAEGRPRDVWRRLRYVIDQARGWSESAGGSLRHYLQWVALQTSEGARVAEAVLPETDDDAVRIMTIHAAKGLQFPVTIVSGMSTAPHTRRASAEVAFPPDGGVGYRFGRRVVTQEFADWAPIDERMGYDERIRLLYVACTRAQDHLVVSLQRKVRAKPPAPDKRTSAELLVAGMATLLDGLPDAVEGIGAPITVGPAPRPSPPPPYEQWRSARADALRAASRPTTVAATALTDEGTPTVTPIDPPSPDTAPAFDDIAHAEEAGGLADAAAAHGDGDGDQEAPVDGDDAGLQKRPRDLDLPPWLKGRYGTAVGRAVHGVLQTVPLTGGDEVAPAVAAQCEAEAIPARRAEVRALVDAALELPVVRDAAVHRHWRELYACTPLAGGRLLEGYVDLLYRGEHGLVVVDYKTAATADPAELSRRAAGYRLQGASYALCVGRTTGEAVVRVAFLFLTPAGAVEVDLSDLDEAVAEVERVVTAGGEIVAR